MKIMNQIYAWLIVAWFAQRFTPASWNVREFIPSDMVLTSVCLIVLSMLWFPEEK